MAGPDGLHYRAEQHCELCCHPIEVRYTVEDDAVRDFEARVVS